jgi:hypothetical protein
LSEAAARREEKILGRLGESGGKIEAIVEAFDSAQNKGTAAICILLF